MPPQSSPLWQKRARCPLSSSTVSGFSRTQIIEMANRRTERRGSPLDLPGEYLTALQEVCMEKRWWWRRRIATFSLVAGQAKYNLLDTATLNMADFQQVARNGFKIYTTSVTPGSGNPVASWNCPYSCPTPIFNADQQETVLALQSQFPAGLPCGYFILGDGTLITDRLSDQNYSASIAYWAVPAYTDDDEDESVPLLPPAMHGLLIKRLELHIERYSLGEGSEKYETVANEYEELKEKSLLYMNFAEGEFREVRTHDHHDSIQST